ncbi:MAG: cysteine methyltransferase [Betaproteobacteria bacterium HGW-Betaproteobacteria-2]|nr:MAG: cysteine methyltransferase [Betaproteobacteria bacterium HGW-Betaproteobacteria-2]
MTTQDFDAIIPAPFGAIGIRTRDDFLLGVELMPEQRAEKIPQHRFAQSVIRQLQQYLNNPGTSLDIPCAVQGTPFQKRVWQAIARIPAGETLTYSELARMAGSGPRAVANACGANHVPLVVPCHRVVAKHGLGGFMQGQESGLRIKRWLLNHERQR